MEIIKAIKQIYPSIEGGFMYWETQQDGSKWENPIDGLVWENKEYAKPTWGQIEKFLGNDLEEIRNCSLRALKSERDNYFSKLDICSLIALEGKASLARLGMDTVGNEYDVRLSEVITQKERLRKCTWALRDLDVYSNEESVILQRIQELEILNFDPLKNLK